jgi:predicted RNA-binding protein YlxR (DUF448 family)
MNTERAPSTAKNPERTCAGCGGKGLPEDMVRFVLAPSSNAVAVDIAGGGFGRGAHVHPGCVEKACKGGFSRAFKTNATADVAELRAQIKDAIQRRVAGLLLGARRAGHVAIGNDAACEALREGAFAVVACDAGGVAQKHEVTQAVTEGRAISFGDKITLGALMGAAPDRPEVALVAVTHLPLGREMKKCIELAGA